MKLTLPTDSTVRKGVPISSGCLEYFPAAIAGVAQHSKINNEKHNPGQEMHHSRNKSSDHVDCVQRHLMDLNDMLRYFQVNSPEVTKPEDVTAVLTEVNALAWRALALSQDLHERFGDAPLAPRARMHDAANEPYTATERNINAATYNALMASRNDRLMEGRGPNLMDGHSLRPKCPACGFRENTTISDSVSHGAGWMCSIGHPRIYFNRDGQIP